MLALVSETIEKNPHQNKDSLSAVESLELVKRCLDGEKDAFKELYYLYKPKVDRLAGYLCPKDQAEDLAQEIFITLFRKMHKFSGRAKFSTWLYRVAVNTWRQQYRKQRWLKNEIAWDSLGKQERISSSETTLNLEKVTHAYDSSASIQEDQILQIREAFQKLSKKHRLVLFLVVIEGMTYDEAGQVLKTSSPSVRGLLYRARKELREKMLINKEETKNNKVLYSNQEKIKNIRIIKNSLNRRDLKS